MATALGVNESTIRYYKKKFGFRLIKKSRCHALSARTIELRRKRAWGLYRMLKDGRHERVVSTDETWVYLTDATGKRVVLNLVECQASAGSCPSNQTDSKLVFDDGSHGKSS